MVRLDPLKKRSVGTLAVRKPAPKAAPIVIDEPDTPVFDHEAFTWLKNLSDPGAIRRRNYPDSEIRFRAEVVSHNRQSAITGKGNER